MKLIVVVDNHWGIGKKNDLLFCLKEDMKHFRQQTLNKVVVMGNNTLKSLPSGKPLKNRTSVILGAPPSPDYLSAQSLDELFLILKQFSPDDIFVAGGGTVYNTLLPYCSEAIVTKVNADGGAEVFLNNLDEDNNWELIEESAEINDGDYKIKFCKYINKKQN